MAAGEGHRKRARAGKAPVVEAALVKWIDNARARNVPLSGPLVREKAEELAAGLGEDDFKVSVGWFERFKRRENIVFKKLHSEAAEADTASREEWLEDEWGQMRQDYAEEDIWNADESGIYFRALPDGTLTFKSDNKRGGKRSKERITALFACSAAGGKKELFVIGKRQNPRCFKNVRTLPVRYAANASAWMTGNLFVEWLKDWDHKLGRETDDNTPVSEPVTVEDFIAEVRERFAGAEAAGSNVGERGGGGGGGRGDRHAIPD
ncbi:hypothetical protein CRUP_005580 [Coryphaenoides rupestris]|nr:hypothetical protein CRUP_005580 [Coryphaenoides rupestris]